MSPLPVCFFKQKVPACDTCNNAYKSLFKTGRAPSGETNSSEGKRTLIDLSQRGHVHDTGSLQCRRILGGRNLVRVRNIVVAAIFDFIKENACTAGYRVFRQPICNHKCERFFIFKASICLYSLHCTLFN